MALSCHERGGAGGGSIEPSLSGLPCLLRGVALRADGPAGRGGPSCGASSACSWRVRASAYAAWLALRAVVLSGARAVVAPDEAESLVTQLLLRTLCVFLRFNNVLNCSLHLPPPRTCTLGGQTGDQNPPIAPFAPPPPLLSWSCPCVSRSRATPGRSGAVRTVSPAESAHLFDNSDHMLPPPVGLPHKDWAISQRARAPARSYRRSHVCARLRLSLPHGHAYQESNESIAETNSAAGSAGSVRLLGGS